MSGINPIAGGMMPIRPPSFTGGASALGGASPAGGDSSVGSSATGEKTDFGRALRDCIENADGDQQNSTLAIQDLLGGKTQDVLPAVAAVAKADLSFKLLMGVRNKVIDAYKQTMQMQI